MSIDLYDEKYYEVHVRAYSSKNTWMRNRIQNVLEMANIAPDDIVLDVGCGIGTFSYEASQVAQYTIGLDLSEASLSVCRRLVKEQDRIHDLDFILADIREIPLKIGSIDKIICADLVEHLVDAQFLMLVNEAFKVLTLTGLFFIYTPNDHHVFELLRRNNIILKREESHVGFRSMEAIVETLDNNGFTVIDNYYKESHVPFFNVLERVLMKIPFLREYFRRRICIIASVIG